jgi:hypothetical protein
MSAARNAPTELPLPRNQQVRTQQQTTGRYTVTLLHPVAPRSIL